MSARDRLFHHLGDPNGDEDEANALRRQIQPEPMHRPHPGGPNAAGKDTVGDAVGESTQPEGPVQSGGATSVGGGTAGYLTTAPACTTSGCGSAGAVLDMTVRPGWVQVRTNGQPQSGAYWYCSMLCAAIAAGGELIEAAIRARLAIELEGTAARLAKNPDVDLPVLLERIRGVETARRLVELDTGDDRARCHLCGCTEDDPCAGGCAWVPEGMQDTCTSCAPADAVGDEAALPAPAQIWQVFEEATPPALPPLFASKTAAEKETIARYEEQRDGCPDYSWRARKDGSYELLAGGEPQGLHLAPVPLGAGNADVPDGFQSGRTYQYHRWLFRCDVVTTHPETGEPQALGWFRSLSGSWGPFIAALEEWGEGAWVEAEEGGEPRG